MPRPAPRGACLAVRGRPGPRPRPVAARLGSSLELGRCEEAGQRGAKSLKAFSFFPSRLRAAYCVTFATPNFSRRVTVIHASSQSRADGAYRGIQGARKLRGADATTNHRHGKARQRCSLCFQLAPSERPRPSRRARARPAQPTHRLRGPLRALASKLSRSWDLNVMEPKTTASMSWGPIRRSRRGRAVPGPDRLRDLSWV